MNEFSAYEFAVRQKNEGKWLAARIGMIALYICYVIAWLAVGFSLMIIVPLLALIPVTLWILIFFTWRYVSVEYEYSIVSGELTFSKIYGGRSRRAVLTLPLRDAVRIAPLDGGEESARATAYRPELSFSAISSLQAPDVYFILFEHGGRDGKKKSSRRAILYFEATAKCLQICRFYNASATVLTKTER